MKTKRWIIILIAVIVILLVIVGAVFLFTNLKTQPASTTPPVTTTQPTNTYGMNQYVDSTYGFSFWYPDALQVTSTTTNDSTSFPGGVAVETLQIGSMGGTSVVVVNSPTSTITDEPADHASPIAQTEYSYDKTTGQWMVSFPQGPNGPGSGVTTTANTSKTTMSRLFMLPSGKRFDTTIIPLSMTRFLVISDGGGSSFTNQLAQTVAQMGAVIPSSTQTAAIQAEAAASAE